MKRELDYSWYEIEDTYVDHKVNNVMFPTHGDCEPGEVTRYIIDENGNLVKQ